MKLRPKAEVQKRSRLAHALLALFLAFGSSEIFADQAPPSDPNCRSVDLHRGKSSPLRTIPVQDQNGTGICYAEVASLLVDYERALIGENIKNDLTDPVYLAWAYNYQNAWIGNDTLSGGYALATLQATRDAGGVCTQADVTFALSALKADIQISHAQLLKILNELFMSRSVLAPPSVSHYVATSTVLDKANLNPHWGIDACSVRTVSKEILDFATDLRDNAATEVLETLFANCQSVRRQIPVPKLIRHEYGTDLEIKSYVDQGMDAHFPVSISLCANVLDDLPYRGLNGSTISLRGAKYNIREGCRSHAVAVTARRPTSSGCQYLVRNSWGSQWRGTGAQSCACYIQSPQGGGKRDYLPDCPPWTPNVIEVVGCWYPQDHLIPNIMAVEGKGP